MTTVSSRGMTDIGRVRKTNEDNFLCDDTLGFWAVADGMGGHDAGEIASDIAVTQMHAGVRGNLLESHDAMRKLVNNVNSQIYRYGKDNNLANGLGTTLVALIRKGQNFHCVHIGDSRMYRIRDNQIEQLTVDHSWVQHQINLGELTEKEARVHPLKNVIMRSLGYDTEAHPDILDLDIRAGDRIVLASDGLTNKVTNDEIGETLRQVASATDCLRNLTDLALERGGEDNITCVIVDISA